jgi:cytoskeletal protein RodZ
MSVPIPMLLRQIRLSQGLSQTGVAEHLGLRPAILCAKEVGREGMTLKQIELYADFLGYDLTLCLKR